jgi:uncharacterized protein (TIGR02421 family)
MNRNAGQSPAGKTRRARKPASGSRLTPDFIHAVCERVAENKRVRRSLPLGGRVHVDRQLPFICLYRWPLVGPDLGTDTLVTGEASYIAASGVRPVQAGLIKLVRGIAQTAAEQFGVFLVVEIWASAQPGDEDPGTASAQAPRFVIHVPRDSALGTVVDTFDTALSRIRIAGRASKTEVVHTARCGPRGLTSVLSSVARDPWCHILGLEVRPIYRHPEGHELYTLLLREFRRRVSRALRQTFYEFVQTHSTTRPAHFHVLGRRAVVRAVWEVDRQLAEVADSFDFLLQVTPVNAEQAWREFRRGRFEAAPRFRYRPVPIDPVVLKRRLYQPPVERVEDPALLLLFRQKQDELDRQITMLLDLNTRRFLQGSLQVFGGVNPALVRTAEQIMEQFPPRTREDTRRGFVDARAFAQRADEEIALYRQQHPQVKARVQVRSDIGSALMVSDGSLLIGESVRIPAARVEALIAHEVGTHIVTYYNGLAQPFQQLHAGLAGYDALQEGLAVLAEHLVGGLSRPRLRLLAARVLVIRDMIDGATFVEAFRQLYHNYGFEQMTAFTIVRRAYRGGGLTKDAVYLQGLVEVLKYLHQGGELDPLFLGKIGTRHIPVIRELRWRGVLKDAPLKPTYLGSPDAITRLQRLRRRTSVLDLIDGRSE